MVLGGGTIFSRLGRSRTQTVDVVCLGYQLSVVALPNRPPSSPLKRSPRPRACMSELLCVWKAGDTRAPVVILWVFLVPDELARAPEQLWVVTSTPLPWATTVAAAAVEGPPRQISSLGRTRRTVSYFLFLYNRSTLTINTRIYPWNPSWICSQKLTVFSCRRNRSVPIITMLTISS